jgi:hypothetical protein
VSDDHSVRLIRGLVDDVPRDMSSGFEGLYAGVAVIDPPAWFTGGSVTPGIRSAMSARSWSTSIAAFCFGGSAGWMWMRRSGCLPDPEIFRRVAAH